MYEPALIFEKDAIFKQNYAPKQFIILKISCCFSFGGNLDFTECLQKWFYNIDEGSALWRCS